MTNNYNFTLFSTFLNYFFIFLMLLGHWLNLMTWSYFDRYRSHIGIATLLHFFEFDNQNYIIDFNLFESSFIRLQITVIFFIFRNFTLFTRHPAIEDIFYQTPCNRRYFLFTFFWPPRCMMGRGILFKIL